MIFPVYNSATRPDPTSTPIGTAIWNTDDNAPQWCDGTYWRDADGNIT